MSFTPEFNRLITEGRNSRTMDLDLLDTAALVRRIQAEDFAVAQAVEKVLPQIAQAVDLITQRLKSDGRLIYFGAGTSGRLGILDATECVPTFGTEPEQVQGFIAGGREAVFRSSEGAEDSQENGANDALTAKLSTKDVAVGIAASGRTPYVIGAMRKAKELGSATIAVTNTPSSLAELCDVTITAITGPEALTGSTRMKAGTAQKMTLNLLTTCTMVRLGKVYENLMVDVKPTNEKLLERAISIVSTIADAPRHTAEEALAASQNSPKTAILMIKRNLNRAQAEELLTKCDGSLRKALLAEV
jgi:N-acetylmuramic acid 6-phosphate etherase